MVYLIVAVTLSQVSSVCSVREVAHLLMDFYASEHEYISSGWLRSGDKEETELKRRSQCIDNVTKTTKLKKVTLCQYQ